MTKPQRRAYSELSPAQDIQGRLSQNTELTVHDLAREHVTAAYIYNALASDCRHCPYRKPKTSGRHERIG